MENIEADALSAGLTVDTCTKDTLEVTIKAIVDIFAAATVKLQALVGTGCEVDITVCAQLIADILLVSVETYLDFNKSSEWYSAGSLRRSRLCPLHRR